jgi:hypothetical protein
MRRRISTGVVHLLVFGLIVGVVSCLIYGVVRSGLFTSASTATTVVPHLEAAITRGKNVVYGATFQLAWDELRSKTPSGQVEMEGNPPLAAALNRGKFPRSDISDESVVVRTGFVQEGVLDAIQKEMNQKFPGVKYWLPDKNIRVAVAFAFLHKRLPFETPFDVLREPLVFHAAAGDVRVAAFGVKDFKYGRSTKAGSEQLEVLSYVSDDDFVIRLKPKADEIVLAKVRPAATLAETLQAVRQRIGRDAGNVHDRSLKEKENLAVPRIALDLQREYEEIMGKVFLNTPWAGMPLEIAYQGVRFTLDETGVKLDLESILAPFNGADEKTRQFIFDKPFLLYLKESKAEQPYLVMWIENAELMQLAK